MEDGIAALTEAKRRFPDIQPVVFGERLLDSHRVAIDGLGPVELHHLPSPPS